MGNKPAKPLTSGSSSPTGLQRRHHPRRLGSGAWRLLATALALGAWASGQTQVVQRIVSSSAGDRLSPKPPLQFANRTNTSGTSFVINDSVHFQTISGFGASFLEAGMICLNTLEPKAQETILEAAFDPEKGAGFSAMKTPLAGTDFMSAGPWYTYDDTPGDSDLKHFSIERDLGPNGLITFIKRAQHHGRFLLQTPMDYPPDWMLFDVNHNQDVNPKYFDALARYYVRYLKEYNAHGVAIDYLSLFNEPGVYTKIPWTKIRDLLKNHVAPLMAKEGVRTKLMLSESSDRAGAARNYPTVMNDPAARRCVAVMPYHGYDLKQFKAIQTLHDRYPDVPLWMTELCHAYEAGTPKEMRLPRTDFEDGAFWGDQIVSDLEAQASAWIYWNLILDEHGGPWAVSPIHGNPDPNAQHPVIVINRESHQVLYTGLYYYLAHFSKFVRPGAIRVDVNGSSAGVRVIAFKTPGDGMAVQMLNRRAAVATTTLQWRGRSLHIDLAPTSITTCLWPSGEKES